MHSRNILGDRNEWIKGGRYSKMPKSSRSPPLAFYARHSELGMTKICHGRLILFPLYKVDEKLTEILEWFRVWKAYLNRLATTIIVQYNPKAFQSRPDGTLFFKRRQKLDYEPMSTQVVLILLIDFPCPYKRRAVLQKTCKQIFNLNSFCSKLSFRLTSYLKKGTLWS
uniref:Uncharacterized protein n=1 Tax=Schistocephalus solidus TaxID=70667 RepID=A0A0V0JA79_SCHSO